MCSVAQVSTSVPAIQEPASAVPSARELRMADVLIDAKRIAIAEGLSWWGVEHLAQAVQRSTCKALAAAREALPTNPDVWRSLTARTQRQHIRDRRSPSPRMSALVDGECPLSAPLITWLLQSHAGIAALCHPPADDPRPATGELEVLFGPEDGRVLTLTPGQTLGRYARDAADVCLYDDTCTVDPTVSRHALTWMGQGRTMLPRPTLVAERGTALMRSGPLTLTRGAILLVGESTWLRCR